MTVEVPPEARCFLEKYRNKAPDSPYLFPILKGSVTNDWALRENYLGQLRRFNDRLGELAGRLFSGSVKLSSYTPRHTWATLMFHAGVSVGLISEAMGHSSIQVTENYLKPFGNERVNKANKDLIDSILQL